MKIDKQIITGLWNAINEEDYFNCFVLDETPFIKFESQYYSNGNRKVKLIIFNQCYEVYNECQKEDIDAVEERCLFICKNELRHTYFHLKDIIGDEQ